LALDEAVGSLLIAVTSGVVLAIAILLILYRMIDGDIPAPLGAGAIVMILGLLIGSVRPPHPALPGVVLVVALTAMAFFPFALHTLERAELQGIDIHRLERAYRAYSERPDNASALFELARCLHLHGMANHAIAIGSATLETLSTKVDPIKNASLKDAFRGEEIMVRTWTRDRDKSPTKVEPITCPSCGNRNAIGQPVCLKCQRPYLLDLAQQLDVRPRIMGRLVLAWAALALFLVIAVGLGMAFQGTAMIATFAVALAAVGGFLSWLFRPRKLVT
jgi:hypothetical protein